MKRTIEVPQLEFTDWYPWVDRKSIKNSKYPGIYMVAISNKDLSGQRPQYEDVSYIGMTNSHKGLQGRWYQFYQSIRGKSGHSGGNTVYKVLGHYDTWQENLFVCALPVICNPVSPVENDLVEMGKVAFLEYDAFAVFFKAIPDLKKPRFNKK
jgi:hypothetical protein